LTIRRWRKHEPDREVTPMSRARDGLLGAAASSVASYQLRNRANDWVGNLCNCSPCGYRYTATLVMDGRIVIYGEKKPVRFLQVKFHADRENQSWG